MEVVILLKCSENAMPRSGEVLALAHNVWTNRGNQSLTMGKPLYHRSNYTTKTR